MSKLLCLIRALIFAPFVFLLTATLSPPTVLLGLMGFQDTALRIVRLWNRILIRFFSIQVKVIGRENLGKTGASGFLMLFNHQSHFDIPILYEASQSQLRFGAKIELFKIPFFGPALRASGMLPIARANRNEVFRVYDEAKANFKKGIIYVLAPEGTRQLAPAIGPFKKGPFVFALNAHAPMIPAVISGAADILPKSHLLPGLMRWTQNIVVEFLPPIETLGCNPDHIDALVDTVRGQMVEAYARGLQILDSLESK